MRVCARHEQAYETECPYCEPADGRVFRHEREAGPSFNIRVGPPKGPEFHTSFADYLFRVLYGDREAE